MAKRQQVKRRMDPAALRGRLCVHEGDMRLIPPVAFVYARLGITKERGVPIPAASNAFVRGTCVIG